MTSAKELRENCDKLRVDRTEELKSALNDYFEKYFIEGHEAWRAVIGNKRCRPIPIHQDVLRLPNPAPSMKWPNLSDDLIRKELEDLGFVLTKDKIRLSVPPCEKGKPLTFAQEWVKKINASYSRYCFAEKKKAKELYPKLISQLRSTPVEKVITCTGYTLFCDFKFDEPPMSQKCTNHLIALMSRDGIEQYYEDGEYKGIRVLQSLSL